MLLLLLPFRLCEWRLLLVISVNSTAESNFFLMLFESPSNKKLNTLIINFVNKFLKIVSYWQVYPAPKSYMTTKGKTFNCSFLYS